MTEFLQLTIANVTLAGVYLLIGQGWNLTIAVSGLLNLAIGGFYMFGGMLSFWFAVDMGLPTLPAAVASVVVVAAMAYIVERLLLRPAGDQVVVQIIATIGVSLILMEAARYAFGVDPVKPPALIPGDPINVGGVLLMPQSVVVVGVAVLATVGLQVFSAAAPLAERCVPVQTIRTAHEASALTSLSSARSHTQPREPSPHSRVS